MAEIEHNRLVFHSYLIWWYLSLQSTCNHWALGEPQHGASYREGSGQVSFPSSLPSLLSAGIHACMRIMVCSPVFLNLSLWHSFPGLTTPQTILVSPILNSSGTLRPGYSNNPFSTVHLHSLHFKKLFFTFFFFSTRHEPRDLHMVGKCSTACVPPALFALETRSPHRFCLNCPCTWCPLPLPPW
jgi:hypothetical protein